MTEHVCKCKDRGPDLQKLVEEFHKKMGHAVNLEDFNAEARLFRARLITEEAAEFVTAAAQNDREAMVDALCDLLYVTFGTGVTMGVNLTTPFLIVHQANMRKTPPRNPLEKPAKPAGWAQGRLTNE